MRPTTIRLAGTLVIAAALTGGAILRGGVAAADPNQDERFLAQLGYEDIPAVENTPTLVAVAHRDCRELDSGMPFDDVVDEMMNKSFDVNPLERLLPRDRVTRTTVKFITAAVDVYCPSNRGKLPQ